MVWIDGGRVNGCVFKRNGEAEENEITNWEFVTESVMCKWQ